LKFKMFRRKNAFYVQYIFERDELNLFDIPHATSATISYKIVYDSEENAKKCSLPKDQAQFYPLALLSTPAIQRGIFESLIKAGLLAEESKQIKGEG
jgi:hypothetical protein